MAELIEKIKISELTETTTADDASYIPIDNGNVTYKITVANYNSGANATAQSYATAAAASATAAAGSATSVENILDEVQNIYNDFEDEKLDLQNQFSSITQSVQSASNSATRAAASATASATSAQNCATIETSVRENETLAESWAVGGTNTRTGEDTNNSKYYAEQASAVVSDLPSIIGPAVEEYIEEHPIQAPVTSVNNQIGDVVLDIPEEVTESTVAGWGFTKNTGTYSKPNTGIPASDLAAAVQTSLEKADTALQSAPVTSVNGQTGAVTVSVPTRTSDLTNDSGFLSSAVTSFNNQTGAVTYTAPVTSVNGMTGDVIVQGGGGSGAVASVNGKTGVVVLDADDVGALPDTTTASDLGAYVKPSGGIPKTDLASAVQTSLGLADTALQSAPVTSVNGQTGAVVIAAATTSANGLMSATDKSHLDAVYADYSSALTALGV